MKPLFTLLVLLQCAFVARSQQAIVVKGQVTDDASGEPMVGAVVYSKAHPETGTSTDGQGHFVLTLPAGKHVLICSYSGYVTSELDLDLKKNLELRIRMKADNLQLQEVEVKAQSLTGKVESTQIGAERISMTEMAKMPALFGERDIIKTLQLLPGIKAESDGSSGFQVRGGTASQNLILLDDATVYNAGHLMGIFSTFNDNALSTATLYKGLIPAQFGGGSSSVFDINTKNGNLQAYQVEGSVGLLAAKLSVEGPLVKDKASFFVSFRRTYFDLYLKLMEEYKNNTLNFYDLNAKLSYNLTAKDKLFVTLFSGHDNLGLDDVVSMKWGNQTANLRWLHQFNSRHYFNTSVYQSFYQTDNRMDALDKNYMVKGDIRQLGLKQSFNYTSPGGHELKYGFQSTYIELKSGEWNFNNYLEREKRNAWENSVWLNDEFKVWDAVSISAGVRFNAFSVLGGAPYYTLDSDGDIADTLTYAKGEFVKTYWAVEPRISINYRLTDLQSLKLGYSRTSQHIRAIRSSATSLPIDRYTMSSNLIEPEQADQVSLGYVRLTDNKKYEFSAESYYKQIQHVLDYKDGKSFSSEIEIERLLLAGKGRSYGLELSARKNTGRLSGWLAYTLAWSENKIPGINEGKWYVAGNDRRHDISVVGMYELSKNWHLAATWVFNTGQALTAPSAKYDLNGETIYYYAERNGYRAPDYHRLDLSATYTKKKKRFTQEWVFGIYNLYNHYNPYVISFENDDSKPSGTKATQLSLFGMLPSVSYNFKF